MSVKTKIHIAADWEQDQSAVRQIYEWNRKEGEKFFLSDDSEALEDMDSEWACFVKKSLQCKIQETDIFLLVVGDETNSVQEGSCLFCENYRNFSGNCAHGRTADKRGLIEFQCVQAIESNKKIVVLYHAVSVDKLKCPWLLRDHGIHFAMKVVASDGNQAWNLKDVMNQCLQWV